MNLILTALANFIFKIKGAENMELLIKFGMNFVLRLIHVQYASRILKICLPVRQPPHAHSAHAYNVPCMYHMCTSEALLYELAVTIKPPIDVAFHKTCRFLKSLIQIPKLYEPRHDKTNKVSVRPARTQISLGIRPVWSESSLCAQWVAKGPRFLHANSEDSDQTGRMPRLIWVFAGRTVTLLVFSCRGLNLIFVVTEQPLLRGLHLGRVNSVKK